MCANIGNAKTEGNEPGWNWNRVPHVSHLRHGNSRKARTKRNQPERPNPSSCAKTR